MDGLPYSQACENNKKPILEVLLQAFAGRREVLEIGAGTGQHATWFAQHLPQLHWRPTDADPGLTHLRPRCEAYAGDNLLPPQYLDVRDHPWPVVLGDAIFTANSLHIMAWAAVQALFRELGRLAGDDTLLAIYGPFNYGGRYTSDSNARFDQWLSQQHPDSAIRDFEAVDALAARAGFKLQQDNAMPANNRLLIWQKSAPHGPASGDLL